MKFLIVILGLAGAGYGIAATESIPLPRPRAGVAPHSPPQTARPDIDSAASVSDRPNECDLRIVKIAVVAPMPRLIGPGACGGDDMIRLEAVLLTDQSRVAIKPAPLLRCVMAEQLALWVREDAAPRVNTQGAALRIVNNYNDYECRSRNRQPGGKLSEHGKGNAIDVRGLTLTDGHFIALTDMTVAKALRDDLRKTACKRFTTVLGPGSDGYHEAHIHLDLAERHNGYRICQWVVREPPKLGPESGGTGVTGAQVPSLPGSSSTGGANAGKL